MVSAAVLYAKYSTRGTIELPMQSGTFIDVACVMDRHVIDKHRDKIEKYLGLAIKLQTLWNTRFDIIPLLFGALGTIHESTIQSFKFLQLKRH